MCAYVLIVSATVIGNTKSEAQARRRSLGRSLGNVNDVSKLSKHENYAMLAREHNNWNIPCTMIWVQYTNIEQMLFAWFISSVDLRSC